MINKLGAIYSIYSHTHAHTYAHTYTHTPIQHYHATIWELYEITMGNQRIQFLFWALRSVTFFPLFIFTIFLLFAFIYHVTAFLFVVHLFFRDSNIQYYNNNVVIHLNYEFAHSDFYLPLRKKKKKRRWRRRRRKSHADWPH